MEMTGTLSTTVERLYHSMKDLPIVSPHGHCDPSWFAQNQPFANPAALLVTPDHYLFRMLYSQGIPMADLGIGAPGAQADPREVFRLFAAHWHLFLGTPTRIWMDYVLRETLQISTASHCADRRCDLRPDFRAFAASGLFASRAV
jgi:glucuronate isomerase